MAGLNLTRGLRDQIVAQVRDDLLAGKFGPHQQLVERELAQRFGVSHAPVREALLELTHEGLLVAQTNYGVRVAPPAPPEVRQLFLPMRQAIETHALAAAFDRLGEEELAVWEERARRLRDACQRQSVGQMVLYDLDFHSALVQRTEQRDLVSAWRTLVARLKFDLEAHYARCPDPADVEAMHLQLIERIRQRDKAGAVKLLESHILIESSAL